MKNLNKVLAMLVVFMMMLSTVAFASSFSDVAETSSYSTAIEVGVDLGLFKGYEDGTFAPEGEITRAEFAAIIVRLLGQEAQSEGAKAATQFADVPASHWAAGYVNIAVQAGVINGYGNGNFGPEDLVEYQDAITMMVRALGYEPAIGAAGYPTGYLTKAGELGLTVNVNGSNGVAANRGAVAQIAFNALDVPTMSQTGYGTFTQYVINDGYSSTLGTTNFKKTLLSENYSIIKVAGVIESSSVEESTSTIAEPYVKAKITDGLRNKFSIATKIDDDGNIIAVNKKVYVAESDAVDYVGKKVMMFLEYNEFEDKLTCKALYEASVDTLVIDLNDLDSITSEVKNEGDDDEYTVFEFKYLNENGKTKTAKAVASNLFYNGVNVDEVNVDDLLVMSGSIELSLLGDTTIADYDTIKVEAYDVFVVDEVATKKVTSKIDPTTFKASIVFDEEDGEIIADLVDANGNDMEWTDLEEYDVLLVKYVKSDIGKKIYKAKVVENTVTGAVTGLSGNVGDDDRYVDVDGTEYKVAATAEDEKEFSLGNEGTFYLDDSDNVVYFNATITRNNNYAFVMNVQEATAMDNAKVRVLSKENGVVTVEVANKVAVTYKGDKATNISVKNFGADLMAKYVEDKNHFDELAAMDITDLLGTIVAYKLNAAGQVSAIEVAAGVDKPEDDYLTFNGAGNLEGYDEDAASFRFDVDGKKHYITEDTVIFYAPNYDKDDIDAYDEDDFEVVALQNLSDDQDLVGAHLYDVDEDRYVGAIALYAENQITPTSKSATFVTKISDTTDEDGYDVVRVTGYKDLEEVTYYCDSTDISVGDLVVPVYKANGDVNYFEVVGAGFSTLDEDVEIDYTTNLTVLEDADEDLGYRSPINTKKKFIEIYQGLDEDDNPVYEEYKITGSTNVYVYDETIGSRNKFKVGEGLGYVGFDIYENDDDDVVVDLLVNDEVSEADHVEVYLYIYDGDVTDLVYYIAE